MWPSAVKYTPNEYTQSLTRRSIWIIVLPVLVGLVILALPFFLIYPLFHQGQAGIIIFVSLIIVSLLWLIRTYLKYHYTVILLTNRRLIEVEQKNILSRSVVSVVYSQIQDISYQCHGVVKSILKIGDIYISLNNHSKLKLPNIAQPQALVDQIVTLQEVYVAQKQDKNNQAALKLLNKIKTKLGSQQYERLIAD